jgi:CheY-like chemotaxis protein
MSKAFKHILIADDDPDDVELFQEAVVESCQEINLGIACDGLKLLSLLQNGPKPSAIILDLNMPRKSGKECLIEIRAKEEFDDVPIAILTTSSSMDDIEFCLKGGANHYFVKPNSLNGIRTIVENICNSVITQIN